MLQEWILLPTAVASRIPYNKKAHIFNASTNSSAAGIGHLMKMTILSLSCQNLKTGKSLQAVMFLAVGLPLCGGLVCL